MNMDVENKLVDIRPLDPPRYAGWQFTARYVTGSYLDISPSESGFALTRRPIAPPAEKSFTDRLFGSWLEAPAAFGAFDGQRLAAIGEGSPESWNNRYRISNLCVLEEADRRRGLGRALMDRLLAEARRAGARMAVLETQTCNEKAIAFYRSCGFAVIGFDLYSYSNDDPARREVRLEMGLKL